MRGDDRERVEERGGEAPGTPGGEWEPKIIALVCNWCTYAGADLAGTSRLKYMPNVRIIKVPCTGRIDPVFIIRAFESGADGVLVSGCHPGDCHYSSGNYHARRRFALLRKLMEFVGIDPGRLQFSWVSAAEGAKWVEVINGVTDGVRRLGPFTEYRELGEWWKGAFSAPGIDRATSK